MMKTNIRLKLIAYTFLLVLIVGGSISLFFIREGRKEILRTYEKKCFQITDLIAQTIMNDVYFLDTNAIRLHLEEARINPDIKNTFVMDLEGKVLTDGSTQNYWADKKLSDPFTPRIFKAPHWISQSDGNLLKIGGPLLLPDGNVTGYLQIDFTLERSYQIINHTTHMNILITLACLAIGAVLAFISSSFLTRPIYKLLKATQEIKKGNFQTRVFVKGNDEFSILANSINQMAEGLDHITASLKNKTEELRRSNKELEQFAYIASHDLQEPLYIIQAFINTLQTQHAAKLNREMENLLERIQNAANRMSQLVQDVLQFSRITTRTKPFEVVNLNQTVQEVLADLELRIKDSHAKIEIDSLPTLYADKFQMRQLFQNLLSNALKFHKKGKAPHIRVKSELYKNFAEILIEDNGIGFESEFIEKIFQPFQRLHSRSEYEGSGIGLAICQKIVERHQGNISAQSQQNEGSQFAITLPLKPEQNLEQ